MEEKEVLLQHELHEPAADDRTMFGFWIYLMTDLVMFAALFAAFTVLRNSTFGGVSIKEIFNPPFVLTETLILLTSSFTCGIGMLSARANNRKKTLIFFTITFLLGISFLGMELSEFFHLFSEGNGFQRSAFLSSFFTLVGTHGLHITSGLFWMGMLLVRIAKRGLTHANIRKLTLFSLFWHFLDIVWIFIFTIVYLLGNA